jgi:glycosyltransferase involved in cell wall biosynthesis
MNILVITGSLYNNQGGPFLSVRSLVVAFLMRGHSVMVIGSKDINNQPEVPPSYKLLLERFKTLNVLALNKYGPYHFHFTPSLISAVEKNKKFDIILIQAVWQWNAWRAFWYGKRQNTKMIVSVRGEFNDSSSLKSLKKRIFIHLIKYIFKNVNGIHVLNENEGDVIKFLGITTPVFVIPNGIFIPESIKSSFPLPKKKEFLFLGRLHPMKNLINLVKGWKKCRPEGWTLKIVGGGAKEFEDQIRFEIGQDKSVMLFGPVNEIEKVEVFNSASWFILPSLTEGMPMAALEAMSHNIPCILSEECNLNDFLDQGGALRVGIEADDIAIAFQKAASMSINDKAKLTNIASGLLANKYTWTNISQVFEDVIQNQI